MYLAKDVIIISLDVQFYVISGRLKPVSCQGEGNLTSARHGFGIPLFAHVWAADFPRNGADFSALSGRTVCWSGWGREYPWMAVLPTSSYLSAAPSIKPFKQICTFAGRLARHVP